ncbi:MAG: exodeoxyribonuclease V subunit alpha [Sedimenticola sp.]|nr:exodeoxyribonuclease V subunit alpha [Sedimenticola sp.]MCW9021778.1 exodeoxyribonuclease V subunit alpha [Sedimenticola sp.]
MKSLQGMLQNLRAQGLFSDLDIYFALLMGRLSGDENRELVLAAALASRASGQGDVCLLLSEMSEQLLGEAGEGLVIRLPSLTAWKEKLLQSRVIGGPGQRRPLILDQADRLYLQRYWDYEQQLAARFLELSHTMMPVVDIARLQQNLAQLFPDQADSTTNWQKAAAAVTVMKRLTVITGGPGTGKTSTVVRIMALLQQQTGEVPLSIALAAPTGKAAARLQDSVSQAIKQLNLDAALVEKIPTQAMTLHRLLGSRRNSIYFRHDHDNPLPYDLLIIDEASMVDVALMAKLIDAIPSQGRLILLGDRNQLASVEAGSVLGDLCSEGQGFTASFRAQLSLVTGVPLPDQPESFNPLADSIVELTHSYRFGHLSGIGLLASAVNQGDAEGSLALLADEGLSDIQLLARDADPVAVAVAGYRPYLQLCKQGASLNDIFKAFDEFRVLCTLRTGEQGVSGLNQAIYQSLVKARLVSGSDSRYTGRPLLITQNDHDLKLYNGDIGILLDNEVGQKTVYFPTSDGFRAVSPARLPAHETAFAMTVHKSQGSEFNRVLLILPDRESPLLSRELIYTGLTRSRSELMIFDQGELLGMALKQRIRRASGLKDLLWCGGK